MKALYLESSGVGRAYLHGDADTYKALHSAQRGRQLYTSALTAVEMRRTTANLVVAGALAEDEAALVLRQVLALLVRVDELGIEPVLARAGDAFPHPVRTLDAIHLATAIHIHQRRDVEELVMFTRDARVRENAAALGMQLA